MAYATIEDLKAWTGDTSLAGAEVERALARAEDDIDRAVGAWPIDPATGRKFDPESGDLEAWRYERLRDATCAQAEYRLHMGEAFFTEGQADSVSGPGVSSSGRLPRLSPQAREQLESGGLLRLTTLLTGTLVPDPRWPRRRR